MKQPLQVLALAVLLCSCTTTSVQKTWKSPSYQSGSVQKVAVLAVSDQGMVREGMENRFAQEIGKRGQAAITTVGLLSLPQIKQDKAGAAARLRQESADSILIVRLVAKSTYDQEVRATPAGASGSSGWYDYYSVAFSDMSLSYANTRDYLVLDSSLFDLTTGKRLWSVVTQTTVKEDADRLVLADKLAATVAAQLLKDGMIR